MRSDRFKIIGLVVMILLGLAVFVALALDVLNDGAVTRFDRRCAETFLEHAAGHDVLLSSQRIITHVGGIPVMTGLAILGVVMMLAPRQYALALGWAVAAGGGALLNQAVKWGIDRERPPAAMRDAAVTETNESYPSGHAMGAVIGYGWLSYVLFTLGAFRRGTRWAIIAGLSMLVLAIGFSRIYLRAHWFSDVVGGFGLGVFWLGLCVLGNEWLGRPATARAPDAHLARELPPV